MQIAAIDRKIESALIEILVSANFIIYIFHELI